MVYIKIILFYEEVIMKNKINESIFIVKYNYHGFAYSRITYAKAAVSPSCNYNQIRHL